MTKIYVKSQLDGILYKDICGDWDAVDSWWNSSNKAFDGKTPIEIYHSGEEGRVKVADYILTHANGSW